MFLTNMPNYGSKMGNKLHFTLTLGKLSPVLEDYVKSKFTAGNVFTIEQTNLAAEDVCLT